MIQKDFTNSRIRKLLGEAYHKVIPALTLKNYHAHMFHHGMVYIINVGENYYKIGKTTHLARRLNSFKMSNPFVRDLNQVVALIFGHTPCSGWTNVSDLEKYIHTLMQAKCLTKKGAGQEIFKLEEKDLEYLIGVLLENSRRRVHHSSNKRKKLYVGGFVPRQAIKYLYDKKKVKRTPDYCLSHL